MTKPLRKARSDGERNRDQLVSTAREVFAEHGIDAPLDLIAKRANLGSATLYRHFPTRESLVLETLRLNLRRHIAVIEGAQGSKPAWEGFAEYVTFSFHEQATDAALVESLAAIRRGTDAEVDRLRQSALDGIERIIARAKAEGAFRRDRWIEDLLLYIAGFQQISETRSGAGPAASERWLQLTLDALSTAPEQAGDDISRTVLEIRRGFTHRLLGEPLEPGDL